MADVKNIYWMGFCPITHRFACIVKHQIAIIDH